MSLETRANVPQLVEKYRKKYPTLDRDLLRKLIRLENKIGNPSELKKLDRYLRKEFQNSNSKEDETYQKEEALDKQGFFDWLERRAERKRLEKERNRKEVLINQDVYLRLVAKYHPELKAFDDWADQILESRKKYENKEIKGRKTKQK